MEGAIFYFILVGLPVMAIWLGMFLYMTRKKKRFRVMTPEQSEHMREKKRYPALDPDRKALGDRDEGSLDADAKGFSMRAPRHSEA